MSCCDYMYRRHQIYVIYEVERPNLGVHKYIAAVNHHHLYGIKAVRIVRRLLRLFSFNCRAFHPSRVATSVHNALLFQDEFRHLEDISPITTHVGMGLDNPLTIQTCSDEIILNQMNDEMISIIDLTKEDNIGYCFMSIATGAEIGNPNLADIPFCSPLSAEEYAYVYWEEDEETGDHNSEEECEELLDWFKGQRVLTIQDIGDHWPTIAAEFGRLYGSFSSGGLAPWRGPRSSSDSVEGVVQDLQQLALQRVVQVFRNRDASRGHLACIPRSCAKDAIAAFSHSKILSDRHIRQFLHLKTVVKEICFARCYRITLKGLERTLMMTSSWLTAMDVSWLDCVTDDVVNVISANCPRLKMLLANGCGNVKGTDLSHQSLAYLDFGQNLSGLPMDIYIYYKDPRRNKVVLGKMRHSWLYGRAAVHFANRLMKFCSNFEETLGDYESLERYVKRLLSCDPEVPYFHENIEIVQESIVPDPFRNLAQFLIQSITPFFLYGGGAITPAGNLCMIIDMTNRDEMRSATRNLHMMIDAIMDPEAFFGIVQTGSASVPPRYAFMRVKPGKKNSFDVYSAREYLELFYPESPSPASIAANAAATAAASTTAAASKTASAAAASKTASTAAASTATAKPPLRRSSSSSAAPSTSSSSSLTTKSWHFLPNSTVVQKDLKRLKDAFENHGMLTNKELIRLRTLVKRS